MFGFTVYSSISQSYGSGEIPFSCSGDKMNGGYAVVATGFDDNKEIVNHDCSHVTRGHLESEILGVLIGEIMVMDGYHMIMF